MERTCAVFVVGSTLSVSCFLMTPCATQPRTTVPTPLTLKWWSMGMDPMEGSFLGLLVGGELCRGIEQLLPDADGLVLDNIVVFEHGALDERARSGRGRGSF